MRSRTMILGLLLLCFLIDRSPDAPVTPHIPEEHVSTSLYGSITLPCTFSFVQSQVGLTMIWDKEEKKGKQIVYWFWKGEENLEEQDPRYRGRVKLSKKFPQGNLDLILRDVTYEDEGTYYCRAANKKDHGDRKVTLSVNDNEEKKKSPDPDIIICTVILTFSIIGIIIITLTLLYKNPSPCPPSCVIPSGSMI